MSALTPVAEDLWIAEGETVLVESGAMAAMDTDVQVESQMMGGLVPAVFQRLLAR